MAFSPEHYDEHLTLKVPVPLWLAMAFLLRHLLLLGITFLPTTGKEIIVLRDLVQPQFLLADLTALPVLLVAMRRRPGAPDWMRRVWRRGRLVLGASVLVYLGLLVWHLAASGRPLVETIDEPLLLSLLLSLAVLAYLWRSPLLRQLFREFPAPTDRTG